MCSNGTIYVNRNFSVNGQVDSREMNETSRCLYNEPLCAIVKNPPLSTLSYHYEFATRSSILHSIVTNILLSTIFYCLRILTLPQNISCREHFIGYTNFPLSTCIYKMFWRMNVCTKAKRSGGNFVAVASIGNAIKSINLVCIDWRNKCKFDIPGCTGEDELSVT